ncbi:MAG: hypothetical protein IJ621_05490 [Paludibacteraceae bacterium]|nr:hypothetical protein [Paludibacteraceae bacterium]
MKQIIIAVAVLCGCINLSAQQNKGLSKEVEEDIKQACKETVDAFTYHISYIGDKRNSDATKDDHIQTALSYFVGDGEGIYLYDKNGEKIMEDGAYKFEVNPPIIEITSLNRESRHAFIKTYLNSLKSLPYQSVKITTSNAYFVSDLHPIKDNVYEATMAFGQVFIAENGDILMYSDYTEKIVRMRITRLVYYDKERWDIKMGDITARETKPAK